MIYKIFSNFRAYYECVFENHAPIKRPCNMNGRNDLMFNPISKICDHDTNVMKIRSDCSIIFKGKNPWKSVKVSKEGNYF